VHSAQFVKCRRFLGKTQTELARLLGVSPKAVQSFEQGWRKVPVHAERQLLLLTYLKQAPPTGTVPCWEQRGCEPGVREACIAWEVRAGHLCWFLNGTLCQGKFQETWDKKMRLCERCEVFRAVMPAVD
jgi:hypothetical protein